MKDFLGFSMKQWIQVAKISGEAAKAVRASFRRWASARVAEIDLFVENLRANAESPPVSCFLEYLDTWSMGDILEKFFHPVSARLLRADSKENQLVCYELPDDNGLASHLEKMLSNPSKFQFDEDRWFATRLHDVAVYSREFCPKAVLVIIRRPIGSSTTDKEIEKALSVVPKWLKPVMSQG